MQSTLLADRDGDNSRASGTEKQVSVAIYSGRGEPIAAQVRESFGR
jgi:hypothetical protein